MAWETPVGSSLHCTLPLTGFPLPRLYLLTIHQGEEASEEELTALAFEKHPSSLRISTRCFPGKNDGLLETCFGPHEHLKGSPSLNLHEDEGWFGGTLAEHQEYSETNVPTTLQLWRK